MIMDKNKRTVEKVHTWWGKGEVEEGEGKGRRKEGEEWATKASWKVGSKGGSDKDRKLGEEGKERPTDAST